MFYYNKELKKDEDNDNDDDDDDEEEEEEEEEEKEELCRTAPTSVLLARRSADLFD